MCRGRILSYLKGCFFTGMLLLVPIWATFSIIEFIVDYFDQLYALVPNHYKFVYIPGLGLITVILFSILIGIIARNTIGKYLISFWERILNRIPVVRSIYMGIKQVLSSMFPGNGKSFHRVVLIRYPSQYTWSIAFQTGDGCEEINTKVQKEMITVYIPTTPNPTSGFIVLVPLSDVIFLDMKVEEAFKMIVSLGVMTPIIPKENPIIDSNIDSMQ